MFTDDGPETTVEITFQPENWPDGQTQTLWAEMTWGKLERLLDIIETAKRENSDAYTIPLYARTERHGATGHYIFNARRTSLRELD